LFHLVLFSRPNLAPNTRDELGQHAAALAFDWMNEEMTNFVWGAASGVFDHRMQRGLFAQQSSTILSLRPPKVAIG
jgi:hypothetical protein